MASDLDNSPHLVNRSEHTLEFSQADEHGQSCSRISLLESDFPVTLPLIVGTLSTVFACPEAYARFPVITAGTYAPIGLGIGGMTMPRSAIRSSTDMSPAPPRDERLTVMAQDSFISVKDRTGSLVVRTLSIMNKTSTSDGSNLPSTSNRRDCGVKILVRPHMCPSHTCMTLFIYALDWHLSDVDIFADSSRRECH